MPYSWGQAQSKVLFLTFFTINVLKTGILGPEVQRGIWNHHFFLCLNGNVFAQPFSQEVRCQYFTQKCLQVRTIFYQEQDWISTHTLHHRKEKDQGQGQHTGTLPQSPAPHSSSWARPDSKCLLISQTLTRFSPDFLLFQLVLLTVCSLTTTSTGLAIYSSRKHSLITLFCEALMLCLFWRIC